MPQDDFDRRVREVIAEVAAELTDGGTASDLVRQHRDMEKGIKANRHVAERIVVALDGPLQYGADGKLVFDLDGNPERHAEQGMKYQLHAVYEAANGGGTLKVERKWSGEQRAVYVSITLVVVGFFLTLIYNLGPW